METLFAGLADIFEIAENELTSDTVLEEAGWDSLAMVSTIALFDELYGKEVDVNALKQCKTVGDVEALAAA